MRLDQVDLAIDYDDHDYGADLQQLQYRLLGAQLARYRAGLRTILVFEGWDAAGKGGCIKRLVHELDPRMCRVWPIAAPRDHENDHHFLYRFWQRLPESGCMAVFDRSWYGRVLVERVEGIASEAEWRRAYREINEFERMQADDGVLILKFFLHISAEEQAKRFIKRYKDPIKRWKLSVADFRNRDLRDPYTGAINDMLAQTDTAIAPWRVIPATIKKHARLNVLKQCVDAMEAGVDLEIPSIPKDVQARIEAL